MLTAQSQSNKNDLNNNIPGPNIEQSYLCFFVRLFISSVFRQAGPPYRVCVFFPA